jgi:hypothetical protein
MTSTCMAADQGHVHCNFHRKSQTRADRGTQDPTDFSKVQNRFD